MNVHELQETYRIGAATWTDHGPGGLRPNTRQYDLNGNAEHHVTLNHDGAGIVTVVHYTIRDSKHINFHLHYYPSTNRYHVDFQGTREPKGIDLTNIKKLLGDFCVMSHLSIKANQGNFDPSRKSFENFQKEQDAEIEKAFKQAAKNRNKKGAMVINLTGGGARRN